MKFLPDKNFAQHSYSYMYIILLWQEYSVGTKIIHGINILAMRARGEKE